MLSTIPSYTALGMASLLPNKEISYQGDTILVDGMNCRSTDERNNILSSNVNDVLAISYDDVDKLTINEFKEKMKGINLVYIYLVDCWFDPLPPDNWRFTEVNY